MKASEAEVTPTFTSGLPLPPPLQWEQLFTYNMFFYKVNSCEMLIANGYWIKQIYQGLFFIGQSDF